MRRLHTAAIALLVLAGFAMLTALMAGGGGWSGGADDYLQDTYYIVHDAGSLLAMMGIAALNGVAVLWHSRARAPRSPALSLALCVVLCSGALLIIAIEIPLLRAALLPMREIGDFARIALAAQWLTIVALFGIIAGWLGWAMGRFRIDRRG